MKDGSTEGRKQTVQVKGTRQGTWHQTDLPMVRQWTSQAVSQWFRNQQTIATHPGINQSLWQTTQRSANQLASLTAHTICPDHQWDQQPANQIVGQTAGQSVDQPTNQPVSQLVSHPASYQCEKHHAPWTWRNMSISAICAPQPANRPACLLYLQSFCAAPSNPFSFLLSLFLSTFHEAAALSFQILCKQNISSLSMSRSDLFRFAYFMRFYSPCLHYSLLV